MKKIRLKCEKCNYEIEILETEIEYNTECNLCNGKMIYFENTVETDNIAMDKMIIYQLENDIRYLGNNRAFEIIEEIQRPEIRIRYRKYFLLAGGSIPEKELFRLDKWNRWVINEKGE